MPTLLKMILDQTTGAPTDPTRMAKIDDGRKRTTAPRCTDYSAGWAPTAQLLGAEPRIPLPPLLALPEPGFRVVRRRDQHQQRRDDDQRQHGGEGQAVDDGAGQRDPPLRRRGADGHFVVQKLHVQPEGDGKHPEDRRQRRQHHRARPLAAGLQDRLDLRFPFVPQRIVGVDQHDVVVHHDARRES